MTPQQGGARCTVNLVVFVPVRTGSILALFNSPSDVSPLLMTHLHRPLCPALMYACKPVTWRGRGDLLQLSWAKPLSGCWLVIDLWSGIGGLPIALLSMGVHFYCLAAESDPDARQACQQCLPHVVHVSDVADVRASDFVEFLKRRRPRGVLVGGGSPCQGNSILNKDRKGICDPRSQQPLELIRIRDEFKSLPEMEGVELVSLLENVGSMPDSVLDQYTSWLGSSPVSIDAACCGWTKRLRYYWLHGRTGGLSSEMEPPLDWKWNLGSRVPAL